MNLLVGAVMAATLAAIIAQIAADDAPGWAAWASLALAGAAIGLAAVHAYPAATRLGAGREPAHVQRGLARSIARDHLICLVAIAVLLAIQLASAG